MSRILYLSEPRGAETSTVSPFFLPMIALPTGDSFESFNSDGSASAEPTIVYSTVWFASTSLRRTFAPIETTLRSTSPLSDHARVREALLELRDLVLEHRLLVLRVVVLCVLGDVSELPRDADAIGHLSALLGRERVDLHFQFLVALRRENDFLQLCCLPRKSRRPCADAGGNGSDAIGRGQYL